MPTSINLLPQEVRALEKKSQYVKYSRIAGFVLFAVSAIFSITTAYLGISSGVKLSNVTKEQTAVNSELVAAKQVEEMISVIDSKSKELLKLIKARPLYSKLLEGLGRKTPSDVTITEVNVLAPEKISISGNSLGYLSLAKFLKALNNDPDSIFKNAVLNSVVLNSQSGSVQFSMELDIKPGSLLWQ